MPMRTYGQLIGNEGLGLNGSHSSHVGPRANGAMGQMVPRVKVRPPVPHWDRSPLVPLGGPLGVPSMYIY